MTTQEILENNKLIAEFMGGKYKDAINFSDVMRENQIWVPGQGICRFDTIGKFAGYILEYHMSYNWLMPVVLLCKERQLFGSQNLIQDIDEALTTINIDNIYQTIINFILWYNENK